ncbi:Peptidase C1 domain containing protein, partial [Asbolus verrucosus]
QSGHQFRLRWKIPETFDLREQWPECPSISKARDEGNCTGSWAFAIASVMTDRVCIASEGRINFEFSAEDILTCCGEKCFPDGDYNDCGEARVDLIWEFLIRDGSVSGGEYNSNEGCKPYSEGVYKSGTHSGCVLACTNKNHKVPYAEDKRHIRNSGIITRDIDEIQNEIIYNGPVVARMLKPDYFRTYTNGVYYFSKGEFSYELQYVKLIGWGQDSSFPYWLGVNSWGKNWGMNGVFQ